MQRYTVFRHLGAIDTPKGRMRESVGLVLGHGGRPLEFGNLRAAVEFAETLERSRSRIGSDCASNVRYSAGWLGAHR